jgi:hypothetical protein
MINNLIRRLAIPLAAALLSANAYAALPVIPNAAGFGIDTPAGRGGRIFRVSNLQASGAGSLEECVAASGPRICVFEVSGVIRLSSNLKVQNPNITIAGQTAPAPGIMIRGAGLTILGSDVLVQHISVRPGDDPSGPSVDSRDALSINANSGAVSNVVIDHCSFSWSIDEVMETWMVVDNVTLANNIFSEPLSDSLHPKGTHAYSGLATDETRRISFLGNLFAHGTDRNPRSGAREFVFANNVVYDFGHTGTYLFSKGSVTLSSLVGNVYIQGPSTTTSASIKLDNSDALVGGSKIFLNDNPGGSSLSQTGFASASAPTWPAGLVARSTANGEVLSSVLANAGSRPAERSAVDAKVIGHVQNGTGRIINCVADDGTDRCAGAANAGGWPNYAQNQRALTVPSNPNGDDNGDGYTNIEEWLHQYAADVEGEASGSKPNPPILSVQ